MELSFWTLGLLCLASFAAAFFDAVVGGGGLITIPALMAGLPFSTPVPTILGTNKVLAGAGTTMAAIKFIRSQIIPWQSMVAPILFAMVGAALGVQLAYKLDPQLLRPIILILLISMLAFTIVKPSAGEYHEPKLTPSSQKIATNFIAFVLGGYDGFFGPGTGSLLIFLFVAVLGFDFLRSSAMAKSVNWASNVASLAIFVSRGSWIWQVALPMAVANGLGGWVGARFAIRQGSAWVRKVFIFVVTVLVARLTWQTIFNHS
ncbi:UPF0721 transmembrane protein [Acidobacteriota bacterium]|nr:UPF0721 transmembrane protein [Acidobacteriota bacterium]